MRIGVVGNGRLTASREGRKEGRKEKEVLFRISVVGNGSLNNTQGGREGKKERREGFVQDRCSWQREPEHHRGRKERRERE